MKGIHSRKAFKLDEIDQAVRYTEPIGPDHDFYVDFSGVRGDFKERVVYRALNVKFDGEKYCFNPDTSSHEKVLFFLGGMRGSGKTSELAKFVKYLHHPDCFFCITCNIDEELDMNDIEYMDILIFQMQKLTAALRDADVKVNASAIQRMERWFGEREREINTAIKGELSTEFGAGAEKGGLLNNLLGFFLSFKAGLSASKEWVNTIRLTFKNKFSEFAAIFNEFIEETNLALRQQNLAKEVLFVVDGLEKTMTLEVRRKIILDESNRLRQIRAYTIFTLPIELMKERQRLSQFSVVESFPFVKLRERNGNEIPMAIAKFLEFVYLRVDKSLFESEDLVRDMIRLSGGSPRELLRIINQTNLHADPDKKKLDKAAFERAIRRMASQSAQYLTMDELNKLKEVKELNDREEEVPYDDVVQELLEKIILMEYNDGSYKRVNPIVELSNLYKQRVLDGTTEPR